jgi:linoleate 10R-lipoxygenase
MNITQSNLRRNDQGFFEDNDLADLLFNAIEDKAGSPGGKPIPNWAREHEIEKLKQARESNVCYLNEFRERLGLKRVFTSVFPHPLSYYLQDLTHSKNGIRT